MKHFIVSTVIALSTLSLSGAALADRSPNADETEKITEQLQSLGYVGWEEIEFDDEGPYWEIDDARKEDGTVWDLKLSENTLEVIKFEQED